MVLAGSDKPMGKEKLNEMLEACEIGWSFCIQANRVKCLFINAAKRIKMSGGKGGIFCNAVYNELGEDAKSIVDACSKMTLKSTDAEALGLERLFEKLSSMHFSQYNEKVLEKHIDRVMEYRKFYSDNSRWYIPVSQSKESWHFMWRLRDLEPGDYGYWTVEAFLDAGIDLSKLDYEEGIQMFVDKKQATSRMVSSNARTSETDTKPSAKTYDSDGSM